MNWNFLAFRNGHDHKQQFLLCISYQVHRAYGLETETLISRIDRLLLFSMESDHVK